LSRKTSSNGQEIWQAFVSGQSTIDLHPDKALWTMERFVEHPLGTLYKGYERMVSRQKAERKRRANASQYRWREVSRQTPTARRQVWQSDLLGATAAAFYRGFTLWTLEREHFDQSGLLYKASRKLVSRTTNQERRRPQTIDTDMSRETSLPRCQKRKGDLLGAPSSAFYQVKKMWQVERKHIDQVGVLRKKQRKLVSRKKTQIGQAETPRLRNYTNTTYHRV